VGVGELDWVLALGSLLLVSKFGVEKFGKEFCVFDGSVVGIDGA